MNAFRVWIRPLGSECRVRVEGIQNARWLLDRLSRSFVFKTCQPIRDIDDSPCCAFRVSYGPKISHSMLNTLLAAIPEVRLMVDPA